jgi:hypothetical protein
MVVEQNINMFIYIPQDSFFVAVVVEKYIYEISKLTQKHK